MIFGGYKKCHRDLILMAWIFIRLYVKMSVLVCYSFVRKGAVNLIVVNNCWQADKVVNLYNWR